MCFAMVENVCAMYIYMENELEKMKILKLKKSVKLARPPQPGHFENKCATSKNHTTWSILGR